MGIFRWLGSLIHEDRPTPPASAPMTPAQARTQPSDAPMGTPGKNEDQRLDEALQETMPGSDPVSIRIE